MRQLITDTLVDRSPDIIKDPGIFNGTPVFAGSRVPIYLLFDYLATGETIDEFLDQISTVSRHQVVGLLDLLRVEFGGRSDETLA